MNATPIHPFPSYIPVRSDTLRINFFAATKEMPLQPALLKIVIPDTRREQK